MRILLVLENVDDQERLKKFLARHKLRPKVSASISNAQERIATEKFDRIVTGLVFNGTLSGKEFVEWLKGRFPLSRVIIYTAIADLLTAHAFIEFGVRAYLPRYAPSSTVLGVLQRRTQNRRKAKTVETFF